MAHSAGVAHLGITLCFLLSSAAGAQETVGFPLRGDSTAVSSGSAEERIPGMKSGTTALLWSLLGTGVPAAVGAYDVYRAESSDSVLPGILLVGGLVIGPSLGHFYTARPGRAFAGIGIRALAGAGVAAIVVVTIDQPAPNDYEVLGAALLVLGGVVIAWDIIRAPHSAHVHNDQLRQGRMAIGVTPSIGAAGLGLRADLSF